MIVELHVLHNLPPSNTNRGEDGAPKEATYGGARRARLSSQAQKRAARLRMAEMIGSETVFGLRSRHHVRTIAERPELESIAEDQRTNVVAKVIDASGASKYDKNANRTKVQLYLSPSEIERLATIAADYANAILDKSNKNSTVDDVPLVEPAKAALTRPAAIDVAMFGRMMANRAGRNIDGAVYVAHAIATHRTDFEFDFYTAVDELADASETGAAMMDVTGFVAPCLYRFACIDTDSLLKTLGTDRIDEAKAGTVAFVQAFATALPSGKQHSYAAFTPPTLVLAAVRPAGATSLAGAFERPVQSTRGSSLSASSVQRLSEYWTCISNRFDTDETRPTKVSVFPGDLSVAKVPEPFTQLLFEGAIDVYADTLAAAAFE